MDDYISRADLMGHIEDEARAWGEEYDVRQILGDIEDFPAADVRPVVRGKWKDSVDKLDMLAGRHEYHCSCCGKMAHYFVGGTEDWFDTHEPNFCSHCGARMGETP